jgi:hypothetical protein
MNKLISLAVALVLVVPIFVGAQTATSTLPDPGTLPDSPLYFLKSWRESIQLFFTFNAEKKAEQYLHLAEVRLAEYERMLEKGKEDIAARTLEKYESQLERALTKAEELKEKGEGMADELKTKAGEVTAKHIEVLTQSLTRVSESAKEGIERALEASRKVWEGFNIGEDQEQDEDSVEKVTRDLNDVKNIIDDEGLENELNNLLDGLE